MNPSDRQNRAYQLLDFGHGRKLERFGRELLCRPCPAADNEVPFQSAIWPIAALNPPGQAGKKSLDWSVDFELSDSATLQMELSITPFGHVGVFPEQLPQWQWLYRQITNHSHHSIRALNLFAYTGGATLAMALAGAQVVHVDASAPSVQWARSNARLNHLELHPIRWIVEDARKFVEREIRRGNSYEVVVLDPPSYGHGPTGKAWDLARDWLELLEGCLKLLSNSSPCWLLWTSHSEAPTVQQIVKHIRSHNLQAESARSQLIDVTGRALDAGFYIRAWQAI